MKKFFVIVVVLLSLQINAAEDECALVNYCHAGASKDALRLIGQGADVHFATKSGKTPLYYAAAFCTVDVVHALIKAGSNVNARDTKGLTPLLCAFNRQENAFALIEAGANVNDQSMSGVTALRSAVRDQKRDLVIKLLARGATCTGDLLARCKSFIGCISLSEALQHKEYELAEGFIKAGADVNVCCDDNATPLHLACSFDSPNSKIALMLIAAGASHSTVNSQGDTPLHRAYIRGFTDVVLALLEKGADTNVRNNIGQLPADLEKMGWQLNGFLSSKFSSGVL